MRGLDNIQTLSGGEDQRQKLVVEDQDVSGLNGDLTEGVLEDDEFVDAKRENCIKARKKMYSALARCTNSEVDDREESGGSGWSRLHANYSSRTLGMMFRVQRLCMCPRPA